MGWSLLALVVLVRSFNEKLPIWVIVDIHQRQQLAACAPIRDFNAERIIGFSCARWLHDADCFDELYTLDHDTNSHVLFSYVGRSVLVVWLCRVV